MQLLGKVLNFSSESMNRYIKKKFSNPNHQRNSNQNYKEILHHPSFYYYLLIIAIINKAKPNKLWPGYREKNWWECKSVQLLKKQKRLKVKLLYNPTIPPVGMSP